MTDQCTRRPQGLALDAMFAEMEQASLDQIAVTREAYQLGPDWTPVCDRPDAVRDQFFEALFTRRGGW